MHEPLLTIFDDLWLVWHWCCGLPAHGQTKRLFYCYVGELRKFVNNISRLMCSVVTVFVV